MIARRWFGTAALLLSLTTHAAADYIYGRVTEVVNNHFSHQYSILPECRLRRHQPDPVSVSQSTTALQGSQRRRPGRCGFPLNRPQARGSPSKNSDQQKQPAI